MTEIQIPDTIKHLDFDPLAEEKEEEAKVCRIPLAKHPVTKKDIRCGVPAAYQARWVIDKCGCTLSCPVCTACWTGYTEDAIKLSCPKHGDDLLMKHLTSLTPIK